MIDITELYRYLLGIEAPWEVTGIELSEHQGRVDVSVGHPSRTRFPCPECGTELSVYDHTEDRAWRHLDSCGCLTYLHAVLTRVALSGGSRRTGPRGRHQGSIEDDRAVSAG